MTKEQLAQKLHLRKYGNELTESECEEAEQNGLVVVYGESKNFITFRGAIYYGEYHIYGGDTVYIDKKGVFYNKCEDCCPYAWEKMLHCKTIEAVWSEYGSPAWTYETDIPHAIFDIIMRNFIYCRGIVFELEALA